MEISLSKGFKFVIFILEKYIEPSILWKKINQLESLLINDKYDESLEILSELVTEWKRF